MPKYYDYSDVQVALKDFVKSRGTQKAAAFWGQLLAIKQPEGGFGKSRIADPNYIDAQKVENIRLNEILDTIRLAKNPNTAGDESV